MPNKKPWIVWHSRPGSIRLGIPSVLAIAETLFAVALYWWIAIHYDTHIHLISSLFVAPLLLLRSNKSIKRGLSCFFADHINTEDWKKLTKYHRWLWISGAATLSFILVWVVSYWLKEEQNVIRYSFSTAIWMTFLYSGTAYALTVAVFMGKHKQAVGRAAVLGAVLSALLGAVWNAVELTPDAIFVASSDDKLLSFIKAVAALAFGFLLLSITQAAGYAIRATVCRITSTICHPILGLISMPQNWWKNNLIIDISITPELMPGIGKENRKFTLMGMIESLREEKWLTKLLLPSVIIPFWFLPAFLYRLNIKATSWLYWPLAFLLQAPGNKGQQEAERDLCWYWTNPVQRGLIIMGLSWFIILATTFIDTSRVLTYTGQDAVPGWMQYLLILDWSALAPWDFANLAIAISGAALLWLAGGAVANYKHKIDYHQKNPWALKLTNFFRKARILAVIATLLIGFGWLIVHKEPGLLGYLPDRFSGAITTFYRINI